MPTKTRHPGLTASQLTKWALVNLTARGYTVWRQNNLSVPGRKFIGLKGVPDVIGYGKEGRAVWCEVKATGDRLSEAQIEFLNAAHRAGCWTFISYDDAGAMRLSSWPDYSMKIVDRIRNDAGASDQ